MCSYMLLQMLAPPPPFLDLCPKPSMCCLRSYCCIGESDGRGEGSYCWLAGEGRQSCTEVTAQVSEAQESLPSGAQEGPDPSSHTQTTQGNEMLPLLKRLRPSSTSCQGLGGCGTSECWFRSSALTCVRSPSPHQIPANSGSNAGAGLPLQQTCKNHRAVGFPGVQVLKSS